MKSNRSDGRGHWPRGKRANADRGNWNLIRMQLVRFLEEHLQWGVYSRRSLADALNVSDRTVRRWLSAEHRPSPAMQSAVEQWLLEARKRVEFHGSLKNG